MFSQIRRISQLRQSGSALLVSIILLSLLAAFATAQYAVVHANIRQATFYVEYSELQKYAESGAEIAMHDLKHSLSAAPGFIGTANWTALDDAGRDGKVGTYDEGEDDGIPTPGEPNVDPVGIGPAGLGAGLIAFVDDVTTPGSPRIVATAATADSLVTVETYLQQNVTTLPRVGALFVSPDVALDLKGNSFLVDGNDHNLDGTLAAGAALHGISTSEGATPGDNAALMLAQIDANEYDQILGLGGTPSVGEVPAVDFDPIFDSLKANRTQEIPAGTHTSPEWGDASASSFPVTYTSGDLHLSGHGSGAGVLIVEGSLKITGQFQFNGLIIVRGDLTLSGGGAGVHVYGSVMVGESLTAVDPNEIGIAGQADVYYSSQALDLVESSSSTTYTKVYYDDK